MNEFMIHVERIVRPVMAPSDRKDRMREELLVHLQDAYEKELLRTPDDSLARQRAIEGLGKPLELTHSLQDSVSRLDRSKARLGRILAWHAPEPAWRYALRVGIWIGILPGLFSLLVTGMLFLIEGDKEILTRARIALGFSLLIFSDVFLLGLLYFKMRDALLGAFGTSRSWLRVTACLVASIALIEGSLIFFLWLNTGNLGEGWDLVVGRSLLVLILPLAGGLIAWYNGPYEIRHAEWECLDIASAAAMTNREIDTPRSPETA
jgi:hypothetical protein